MLRGYIETLHLLSQVIAKKCGNQNYVFQHVCVVEGAKGLEHHDLFSGSLWTKELTRTWADVLCEVWISMPWLRGGADGVSCAKNAGGAARFFHRYGLWFSQAEGSGHCTH